jgi:hypothetical protein
MAELNINRRDVVLAGVASGLVASPASGLAACLPDGRTSNPDLLRQLDQDLKTHASFGIKLSGGMGDRKTGDWIAGRLKAAGFSVDRPAVTVPAFDPSETRLVLNGGHSIELFAQAPATVTPKDGVTAKVELVYSTHQARSATGAIAVVVVPYGRHAALFTGLVAPILDAALAAKPAAVVLVPTGPTKEVIALNTRLTPQPVPWAIMAPRDLPKLEEALGPDKRATLLVTGQSGSRQSSNVIATRKSGPNWLVLSTPRTGWFECVGERGTGTAAFLELAQWATRTYPDLSILAMNSGGHEYDFIGTREATRSAPTPPERTKLWVHIGATLAARDAQQLGDRVTGMLPSADPQRVLMTTDTIASIAKDAFAGLSGYERPIAVVPGAGELGGIVAKGYDKAFAVLGIHRWLHTRLDDLEKVDAGLLLPVVEAHRSVMKSVLG